MKNIFILVLSIQIISIISEDRRVVDCTIKKKSVFFGLKWKSVILWQKACRTER